MLFSRAVLIVYTSYPFSYCFSLLFLLLLLLSLLFSYHYYFLIIMIIMSRNQSVFDEYRERGELNFDFEAGMKV